MDNQHIAQTYDLVIIGRGLAGLCAIKKAIELGLNTCVIFKNSGASQHFSGAFDVVDAGIDNPQLSLKDFPTINTALQRFIKAHPRHILSQLAKSKTDTISEAKNFFGFYNIPIICDEKMLAVFGPNGKLKPTGFALKTQALTASEALSYQNAVYVDFESLTDYHPHIIKKNLGQIFNNVRVISYKDLPLTRQTSMSFLLNYLDNMNNIERVASFLKQNINENEVVFLPPVLGIKNSFNTHNKIQHSLNTRIVELLSILPSSSGLRFQHIIDDFFANQKDKIRGLDLINATVTGFNTDQSNKVLSVDATDKNNKKFQIKGNAFVLASGKYLGGGHRQKTLV